MSQATWEALQRGELQGARRISLACGLKAFPRELFALADSLEILDLSGNALSTLPDDLPRLHRLQVIFCSDNAFTELPEVLGRCESLRMVGFKANRIASVPPGALPPRLRWLILTDNAVSALPETLGQCPDLQKLMLSGNRLRTLPDSLARCTRLELLRIAANEFEAIPQVLTALPRLTWLAFGGNPCSDREEQAELARHRVIDIPWADLRLGEPLGEGASGVIYRAHWQSPQGPRAVAVKCFKGAMTSDGLPHTEMNACLCAGNHPDLITVLGRVAGHPQGTPGLVMDLIDPAFRNMAGPPSLESCTRDVYGEDQRFTFDEVMALASGLASVAGHLHGEGILHGDFYAHNILHDGQGRAILGDFGAASFYDHNDPLAPWLERLEVRAFGCLLEEWLARLAPGAVAAAVRQLATLRDRCLAEDSAARPDFRAILNALSSDRPCSC